MKKKLVKSLVMAAIGTAFAAGSAWALPINSNRPFDNGNLTVASIAGQDSVQTIMNKTFTSGGPYHAVNDQSDVALWGPDEAAIDTYLVTMINTVNTNFGIYSASTGATHQFSTAMPSINFSINDFGDLYVGGSLAVSNFGGTFGFWAQNTSDFKTYFTEDDKNNGEAHALSYQLADGTSAWLPSLNGGTTIDLKGGNDWMIAFEDWAAPANGDFNDLVFIVEDIQPVPEPATMLLFGTGLAGLSGMARRRRSKK